MGSNSLAAWNAESLANAHAAAAALLGYAEHTQGRALSHVQRLAVERDGELIELPPTTRRNLELVQTLRGEDSPTLFSLLDTCMTGMGSRLLKRWLLAPRRDRGDAQARLEAIDALQSAAPGGTAAPWRTLREQLKNTSDVERIAARIALRQVRPRELVALRMALAKAEQLAPALPALGGAAGAHRRSSSRRRPAASNCWWRAIHPEPAALVRDGGVIADRPRRRARRAARHQRELRRLPAAARSAASASAPASPTCACSSTACTASTSRSRRARSPRCPTTTAAARR